MPQRPVKHIGPNMRGTAAYEEPVWTDAVSSFVERMQAAGRQCVAVAQAHVDAQMVREEVRLAHRSRPISGRQAGLDRQRRLLHATAAALRPYLGERLPSARIIVGEYLRHRTIPTDWAIPVEPCEMPIATAPLPKPLVGFASILVRVGDLDTPAPGDEERDRIADALVDALLKEIR
jgi:hypothetical protein